jgi:two-component system chemotaxis response regulator CheY
MGTAEGDFTDLRVLVLDDSRTFRQLLQRLLHQIGIRRVETTANPLEATARIGARSFDLLFVEQVAAGADGIGWLGATRAGGVLAGWRPAVVMVAARPRRRQVEAAIDAGVDGYLIKPFSLDGLRRHLRAVFDHRRSGAAGDRGRLDLSRLDPPPAIDVAGGATPNPPRRREPAPSVPGLDVDIRPTRGVASDALFVD